MIRKGNALMFMSSLRDEFSKTHWQKFFFYQLPIYDFRKLTYHFPDVATMFARKNIQILVSRTVTEKGIRKFLVFVNDKQQ